MIPIVLRIAFGETTMYSLCYTVNLQRIKVWVCRFGETVTVPPPVLLGGSELHWEEIVCR